MIEIEDTVEVTDRNSVEAKMLVLALERKLKSYCLEQGLQKPVVRVSWKRIGTRSNPRYRAAVFAGVDRS
ncbi:MAG TPA: hypothetical protein VGL24_02365 [Chthoniobacterales bacterium]|jgi:hypothetical protein